MSPTIRIDDEAYAELKTHAEPFIDTPNTVLRRLLHLDPIAATDAGTDPLPPEETLSLLRPPADAPPQPKPRSRPSEAPSRGARAQKPNPQKRTRAAAGTLLPEDEYDLPVLEALYDAGGEASSRDVIKVVGERLADRLTDIDRQELRNGVIRWANRVQFVRLRLIQQGFMVKEGSRGVWAISDAGRRRVEQARSAAGTEGA